ncbi:EAL domain-containing protein [Virgibacillus halodenitrificans]|nr:EAL domain-containing protein [Virgibacillus halodenitrificans]
MFNQPELSGFNIIEGDYSSSIIILSIIIAIFASYTALVMNQRVRQNSFFNKHLWSVLAAFSMGVGIWSMHFIGMSAMMLPVHMHYDRVLTIVSIIPAIVAAFIAFHVANKPQPTKRSHFLGGLSMGAGISLMHYIGMDSMHMEGVSYYYHLPLFTLSIIVAIIVSFVALYVFSVLQNQMKNWLQRLIVAVIMGIAISSMHYIGMAAVVFYVPKDFTFVTHMQMEDMHFLLTLIINGLGITLLLFLLMELFDRFVSNRINYYDSMTKLPNYREFERRFSTSTYSAIALIDMDKMDKRGSLHGYMAVDELMKKVAARLFEHKPSSMEIYRMEGRKFAFVSHKWVDKDKLAASMQKMVESLSAPFPLKDRNVTISTVCAIAMQEEDNKRNSLYANALAILQDPNIQYTNQLVFYDENVHRYMFEQGILQDVDKAFAEDQFFIVYQPKMNMLDGHMVGVEALLRWQHPVQGLISPGVFIPILEKNHRIQDVTRWVIKEVCKQLQQWQLDSKVNCPVSINIPGECLTSHSLVNYLKEMTETYQIDPKWIELEITETSFVASIQQALRGISALRKEGFSIALDDFGTGVSSLSYLKQMPISTLKIDKSFLDDVPHSRKDASIIQSIISLGRSLDLNIVVEGAETKEQIHFLADFCDNPIIQGYYYSRPLPALELSEWYSRFTQPEIV